MDSGHVDKWLSLLKRGIVTVPEIANGLLVDLMRDGGPDSELSAFVAGLPVEVQQRLRDLLREIKAADYHWKPFVLGPGGSVLNSEADDSAKLRRLCAALDSDALFKSRKGMVVAAEG